MEASEPKHDLRQQAINRLEAKRDFLSHLAIYFGVSVLMVAIWAWTGTDNFFWPAIPILAWGIFGIIPNWWTAYKQSGIPEDKIQAEMEKIQRDGGPGGPTN
ncbi:MAG: 2TM domain-containing protein [Solirubrobacterales bacterium]|nr:2TM domain-containing protein [Solirubrobacterales bacterium]